MTQSSSLDSRELWAMIKADYPEAVVAEKESFYAVCPQPDAPPATRWLLSEQQAMEEFLEWDAELQKTAARIAPATPAAVPQPATTALPPCNPTPADYQAASLHVLGVESYPEYQCRVRQLSEQLPFVQATAKFDSEMLASNMRIEDRFVTLELAAAKMFTALKLAEPYIDSSSPDGPQPRPQVLLTLLDAIAAGEHALHPAPKTGAQHVS
jgi:hypothetical protein